MFTQDGIILSFYTDNNIGHIQGVAYEHNGFCISGSKLSLHRRFSYGNLCKQFGSIDTKRSIAAQPRGIKQRNVTFIPVVRYIEILTSLAASSPKAANRRGDNCEYEVGRRGRRWERIDDHIQMLSDSKRR
ncbi:MAG: hypothetical protein K2K26_10900 [Muribaculaceae bacterium]|nr:hypothetical protein [Muribaculaceae bacterium]